MVFSDIVINQTKMITF